MKFIGLLFLLTCLNTHAQDCEKYKTGTFELDNEDGTVSIIKRTKKFQTESNGEVKFKDKIVWLSDCSYQLIPIKSTDPDDVIGEKVLTFTFVKTFEHSYVVEITGMDDMVFEVRVYEEGYLPTSKD